MMLHVKKYLLMLHVKKYLLLVIASCTLTFFWWYTTGTPIEEAKWSCHNGVCTFTNFCVDKANGPFIISSAEPPKVNLMNVGKGDGEVIWFQPKRKSYAGNAHYVNETLFVYGLYSPFHFSHFLYNGLMPLFSTMLEYKAPATSWTLRGATFWNKHTPIDLVLPSNQDIVLESSDRLTSRQISPTHKPMCFRKAVVGTGNRCSLFYCDGQIPSDHYQAFKDFVMQQPVKPNDECASSRVVYKNTGQYRVGILNRKNSRHITNLPELISRLIALQRSSDGIDYSVVTIDFEKGCDIVSTANVVKDLDILIAPFGNGLGAGLFMKNDATVISISSRYYTEDWFKYPMTAIGRRIFDFRCNSSTCQQYEEERAASILENYGVTLNVTEMTDFVSSSYPKHVLQKYLSEDELHTPIAQYHKDVARRIDVDSFLPYLKNVMDNKPLSNVSYHESCKKENVCCDLDCGGPLGRNIFGENNAWGK